jgi:protein-tyrosine-phosphatase/SAM-dependent methyltransferase
VTAVEVERDRQEAVAGFFTERSERWRDIYRRPDFDGRNFQLRAAVALGWLEAVRPSREARLLEIGSGAGAQAGVAAARGWRVHGVDLSLGMLRQAAAEMPGPAWVAADGDVLPFADAEFDAVLLNGVIGYVADPLRTLAEIRRVLRPGGHLVISWASEFATLERAARAVSAVGDAVYLLGKRLITGKRATPVDWKTGFYARYLRYWNERDFCAMLEHAEFNVLALHAINFGQLRFMERKVWPAWGDVALSSVLERLARSRAFAGVRNHAKTHVALVQPAALPAAPADGGADGSGARVLRASPEHGLLRKIKYLPDRVFHALRRAALRRALRRRRPVTNVLVLCHGNICRSPYAAAVLDRLLSARGVRVHSAGFVGPARPAPGAALDVARRRGVDLRAHRSCLVTRELIRAAQLVVVMDRAQARAARRLRDVASKVILIGDLDPLPIARRSIHDPWDQSTDAFVDVFARLDRCAGELAAALRTPGS